MKNSRRLFWAWLVGALLAFQVWSLLGVAYGQCPGGSCPTPESSRPSPWFRGQQRPAVTLPTSTPTGHQLATVRVCNAGQTILGRQERIYGSGVVVNYRGRPVVLTCWHLFRESTGTLSIRFTDGSEAPAAMVSMSEPVDLAILSAAIPTGIKPAEIAWGEDGAVPVGAVAVSCGFGERGQFAANSGKVLGYASPGKDGNADLIRISGAARQGDSGGPIFDGAGRVVGILAATDGSQVVGAPTGRAHEMLVTAYPTASESTPAPAMAQTKDREKILLDAVQKLVDRLDRIGERPVAPAAPTAPAAPSAPVITPVTPPIVPQPSPGTPVAPAVNPAPAVAAAPEAAQPGAGVSAAGTVLAPGSNEEKAVEALGSTWLWEGLGGVLAALLATGALARRPVIAWFVLKVLPRVLAWAGPAAMARVAMALEVHTTQEEAKAAETKEVVETAKKVVSRVKRRRTK